MAIDSQVLLAIVGMAVVTYATRLGGYLLIQRITPGPFLARVLEQVPGCTFAALAVPLVAAGGPLEWFGAAVTALVLRASGNVPLAVLCYPLVVSLGRAWL